MLKMDLEYEKGILFVRLKGYLNHDTTYKINNYLIPLISKHKIKYLVFNLYELADIDSFGIDSLLNVKTAIKNNKGITCLCEVNENIDKKMKKMKIKVTENELTAIKMIEV